MSALPTQIPLVTKTGKLAGVPRVPETPGKVDNAPVLRWQSAFFPGMRPGLGRWETLPLMPKIYWKSADSGREYFAAGAGLRMGLEEGCELLRKVPSGVAIYGGRSFFDSRRAGHPTWDAWRGWPEELYFAPVVELECCDAGVRVSLLDGARAMRKLGWRTPADAARALLKSCDWARGKGLRAALCGTAIARHDAPTFEEWVKVTDAVLSRIAEGRLHKAVLARASRLRLAAPVRPFVMAARLAASQPGCSQFCLQISQGVGAFLGATPERLFVREERMLRSEAIAGTRPRSLAKEEDERLERLLWESCKDRTEQRMVADDLARAFDLLCEPGWVQSGPHVMRLAQVRHLRTHFEGTLRDGVNDAAILRALHPTPATGGLPREEALQALPVWEGWERGWFAAPVMRLERGRAEALVAIRSARVWERYVEVYAGAGIVEGSQPEEEWRELEEKAGGILRLFGEARLANPPRTEE